MQKGLYVDLLVRLPTVCMLEEVIHLSQAQPISPAGMSQKFCISVTLLSANPEHAIEFTRRTTCLQNIAYL